MGRGPERDPRHRTISAPNPPTSLERSARRKARQPVSILPFCNTDTMNLNLAEISLNVAPGAHAVLLMDQAGWHLTPKLVLPTNISIVAIPSKCPELNGQENIWQFMRDNWLSNRVFGSYDEIVDHCCHAWNKLVEQPWKIMSIGLRDWAYAF